MKTAVRALMQTALLCCISLLGGTRRKHPRTLARTFANDKLYSSCTEELMCLKFQWASHPSSERCPADASSVKPAGAAARAFVTAICSRGSNIASNRKIERTPPRKRHQLPNGSQSTKSINRKTEVTVITEQISPTNRLLNSNATSGATTTNNKV